MKISHIRKYFLEISVTLSLSTLAAFVGYVILSDFGAIGRTPKVGDMYVYRYDDNPFIEHPTNTVIAVKDGWVLCTNQYQQSISQTIERTRGWYKFVGNFQLEK